MPQDVVLISGQDFCKRELNKARLINNMFTDVRWAQAIDLSSEAHWWTMQFLRYWTPVFWLCTIRQEIKLPTQLQRHSHVECIDPAGYKSMDYCSKGWAVREFKKGYGFIRWSG